jgi:hypothetical protein
MKSCNCDNCYYGIDGCEVVIEEVVVEEVVVELPNRKCPGAIFDCGVTLYDDEDLCESCLEQHHILELRRGEMEDQAVAELELCQILLEEQQWEEAAEDEATETAEVDGDDCWF